MKILGDKNCFLRVFFHERVSIFIIYLNLCQKSVRACGGPAGLPRGWGGPIFWPPPSRGPVEQLSTKAPVGLRSGIY